VDDHPLYGEALASALRISFSDCETRRAETLKETFDVLDAGYSPDLVMFDLKLPDVMGISGFRRLKDRLTAGRVLVISSLASVELVQSLLQEGADGFLPKDASSTTLKFAIREVAEGRRYVPQQYQQVDADVCPFQSNPELSSLTGQQRRILKLICAGKANKQIAYELSLAEATVKAHITALLRRLGVQNRTQAVLVVESAMMRHGGNEPEARAFLAH
jgi:DNA-binding NarL/FixJ family response regulator